MPTVRAYSDSSEKSGFYILANVGGSHPITLQVSSIAERILRSTGYQDGDDVPNKVVWAMYDVGILFTSGSIETIPEQSIQIDKIFSQLNVANRLTAAEQSQLLNYLKDYTGPNRSNVQSLQSKLESIEPEETESSERASAAKTETATNRTPSHSSSSSSDSREDREQSNEKRDTSFPHYSRSDAENSLTGSLPPKPGSTDSTPPDPGTSVSLGTEEHSPKAAHSGNWVDSLVLFWLISLIPTGALSVLSLINFTIHEFLLHTIAVNIIIFILALLAARISSDTDNGRTERRSKGIE